MKNIHVLAIPYPAQGHVMPLLEAARCFTSNGLKVTFVNTDFTHKRVMMSAGANIDCPSDLMHMVSIPDGMEPCDDRNDLGKLTKSMFQLKPAKLEELINDINKNDDEKITCIVVDYCMGWVLRVARKMGIRLALFCPSSAAVLALSMSVQKLIDDEIINNSGVPLKDQMVQLSASMPLMDPANFVWACVGDSVTNQIIFEYLILEVKKAAEAADHIICNSTMELETGAFTLFPKMLPIGPLLATNRSTRQVGHFWNEDTTCLTWLDQQPVGSVIYVAFGSFTIFDQHQFEELALALEDTNKPFLWVVRPGPSGSMDYIFPSGYLDRIGTRGKLVSWAPQQEVLNHPSVACFMSHCGWNSTMEGVSNGVPFVCWPYFADQFFNKTYICDIWKTGLGLNKDETGIVTRGEITSKLEQLLSNIMIKENALSWQEKVMDCVGAGHSLNQNLNKFIDWVREGNDHAQVQETCK
ncbi:putative trans-zeatin O-beta-D-glucosyltransferase [Helianthus annuus]|nr:putative trans-zeatin O-beta-D-glucosyltransferase [Helianthus annuus]